MAQRLEPSAHLNNSLAKEARGQVYMATNILLLYGSKTHANTRVEMSRHKRKWRQVGMVVPNLGKYGPRTRTTANVEKTRQKRKRLQVRMVAFEWKGAIQACREYNVERFIGNERE